MNNYKNLGNLVDIVKTLRSPKGCPWDREQTHQSIRKNFIEETYEAVDAIDNNDIKELKEELGDVLLQVVLHSQIADDENNFNIEDVARGISDKLIRRHPHVFSDVEVENSDEVVKNWDEIKNKEKPERTSVLDGVSNSLPALYSAMKYSKKAVKVGFEWPDSETLFGCLESEITEFKEAANSNNKEHMLDELGDILFSVVNVARWHKLDPEEALAKANKKFKIRFQKMEELAAKELTDYSFEEWDELWNRAKENLKNNRDSEIDSTSQSLCDFE